MTTIRTYKADPLGSRITPGITIEIDRRLPEVKTLKEATAIYDTDAKLIFDALIHSLPGGTIDRLTARLLIHKASLLAIPHINQKGE